MKQNGYKKGVLKERKRDTKKCMLKMAKFRAKQIQKLRVQLCKKVQKIVENLEQKSVENLEQNGYENRY